jgi:AcrR family transcriptional regulator
MTTKAQDRRQKLRMDLIDAAERRIAADGLAALTARGLAQEVGCALGAIYNVFPDLDTLVISVNSRTLTKIDRTMVQSVPAPSGKLEDLREFMVGLALAYANFARQNTNLWLCLFEAGMQYSKPQPEWHLDEHLRLFERIVDGLRPIAPQASDDRIWLLARALFSAVHGIVQLGIQERFVAVPESELDEQITIVVRSVIRGIRKELS